MSIDSENIVQSEQFVVLGIHFFHGKFGSLTIGCIHVDTKIAWVVFGAKYAVHIKNQMLIYFI